MIRYTTPTKTVKVKGIDLTGYDVTVSIRQVIGATQNAHEVDIGGDAVSMLLDGSDTDVTFTLTQEQSGGFARGWVEIQVNYGSGSTRMATSIISDRMEENLKSGVVEFAVSTDPDTAVPESFVVPVTETYVPAVTSNMLASGAVTTPKIADGAVTADKLADGAVMASVPIMSTSVAGIAKVGAGLAMNGQALELDGSGDIATAVGAWLDAHPEATTTVQDGAITTAKLANGAVTDAKLDPDGIAADVATLMGMMLGWVSDGADRRLAIIYDEGGE